MLHKFRNRKFVKSVEKSVYYYICRYSPWHKDPFAKMRSQFSFHTDDSSALKKPRIQFPIDVSDFSIPTELKTQFPVDSSSPSHSTKSKPQFSISLPKATPKKPIRSSDIRFSIGSSEPPTPEEVQKFKDNNTTLVDGISSHIEKNRASRFNEKLFYYINKSGETDSVIYKRANIDRRLFSKIISGKNYIPSHDTIISLGLGMKLSLQEVNDLLSSAGYALSHSSDRDLIIEYCFKTGINDIDKVNCILYHFQKDIL